MEVSVTSQQVSGCQWATNLCYSSSLCPSICCLWISRSVCVLTHWPAASHSSASEASEMTGTTFSQHLTWPKIVPIHSNVSAFKSEVRLISAMKLQIVSIIGELHPNWREKSVLWPWQTSRQDSGGGAHWLEADVIAAIAWPLVPWPCRGWNHDPLCLLSRFHRSSSFCACFACFLLKRLYTSDAPQNGKNVIFVYTAHYQKLQTCLMVFHSLCSTWCVKYTGPYNNLGGGVWLFLTSGQCFSGRRTLTSSGK